jgi:tetratricopeptide (TPR) repeat protein
VLRRILGPYTSDFARLVPDIAAKLGTIPPSKALGEQQDRIRLFEAVTQFFISIGKETPLLLLLDDMQYVDQASLDLMEYFVRATSNLRILTVCSSPAEHELETNSPLELTLMKLNKERILETVTVRNLNIEQTADLVKRIFGEQTLSPEFTQLIYERTGGNPFFIEEVLHALVDDGTIFRTEKGWDRKPIQDLTIPKSVKAALRARLAKLDAETLGLLQWAAVIGSEFEFEVLLNVAQINEDTLVQKLETVITQGLISEVPHQKSRLKFADSRIRELLLDDLIQLKRTRYHLKIAEAMERASAKNIENRAEAIANQFSEAGDSERAIKYSIMAGDRNRTIHAYEQAVRNYRHAFDLLNLEGANEQAKAGLLEKLASALYYAGKIKESVQSYQEALETYERLHDAKACAKVCTDLGTTLVRGKNSPESTVILKRGLKYLEGQTDSYEAASIYARLADFYSFLDEWDETNQWVSKALEVGEKTKNFRAVATATGLKASYLCDTGKVDEGLPLWEQVLNLALANEDYDEAVFDLLNLSIYTLPRDLNKGREFAIRLLELSKRVGEMMGEARAWGILSLFDWLMGDWTATQADIQNGQTIRERVDFRTEGLAEGWRARVALSLGNLEEAERLVHLALADQWPKVSVIVGNNLAAGLLRLEQGKEEEAKRHFEAGVEAFMSWEFTTRPLDHIETLLHLAEIYSHHDELEKARKFAQWGRRLAEALRSDAGLAMVLQAEANILQASGDLKGAEEAYMKSLALWERAGWIYYRGKALASYGANIAKTSPAESRKRKEEAAAIFKKLGAKRDLERVQAELS